MVMRGDALLLVTTALMLLLACYPQPNGRHQMGAGFHLPGVRNDVIADNAAPRGPLAGRLLWSYGS